MQGALYFLIAVAATTVEDMTGMGGGVIIKLVLDVLGQYDVKTIGILSYLTVFAMSLVSAGKHVRQKMPLNLRISLPLAIGSLAGGSLGAKFNKELSDRTIERFFNVVQLIVLGICLLNIVRYTRR